jgi:hypothetical protein
VIEPPFIYVHCDVPAGRPLRPARAAAPRPVFVARLCAEARRLPFVAPGRGAAQRRARP